MKGIGEEIEAIAKSGIAPEDVEEIGMTDLMVILRDRGRNGTSCNLILRASVYDTCQDPYYPPSTANQCS